MAKRLSIGTVLVSLLLVLTISDVAAQNAVPDIRQTTTAYSLPPTSVGPISVSWTPVFADTNYTAVCTTETVIGDFLLPTIMGRTTDSMLVTPSDGGTLAGVLNCIGIPDTDSSDIGHARVQFSGHPSLVTLAWNAPFPDANYTVACTAETEGSVAGGFTSVISAVTPASVTVTNDGYDTGTMHCIAVPDSDSSDIRHSRSTVEGTQPPSTLTIQWSPVFKDSAYVAVCSDEMLGAAASDAAIAILAGSKTAASMVVIPEISSGVVNCIGIPANDEVTPLNLPAGNPVGLLVNGIAQGSQWDHHTIGPTTSSPIDLGTNLTLSSAANGNELIGFTSNQPPTLLTNIPWTPDLDDIQLSFRGTSNVSIKFWIVYRDSARPGAVTRKIVDSLDRVSTVWRTENLGFSPMSAGIVDASSNFTAPLFDSFACWKKGLLKFLIGYTPGMINVYFVHQIAGAPPGYAVAGTVCSDVADDQGDDFAAVAVAAPVDTLVHEIGHDLSLQHTGTPKGPLPPGQFDRENIMWQGSGVLRQYLSEGQTFRSNFNPGSALIFLYKLLPPIQTRYCPHASASLACPPIDKRIWNDGALGPN